MPEGPSILLVKQALMPLLKGKKITTPRGNAGIEMARLKGQPIRSLKTWGKHLLIVLPDCTIRIHFLMFGTYTIDRKIRKQSSIRLQFKAGKHHFYFYTCAIRLLEGNIREHYDWEADVLSSKWNPAKARKKLKAVPGQLVCDSLMDQTVFAGVGNIIKNEVLYRIRVHPEARTGDLPSRKLGDLVREASTYSHDFLKWKKAMTLAKHWLVYTKKTCVRCQLPLKKKYCGTTRRRTFFCDNCQLQYDD